MMQQQLVLKQVLMLQNRKKWIDEKYKFKKIKMKIINAEQEEVGRIKIRIKKYKNENH